MKRRIDLLLSLVIFMGLMKTSSWAQGGAVDSLFYEGIEAYKEGQYRQSLTLMEALDRVAPNHARMTGSLLMQGKAYYKLGEYRTAVSLYEKLIQDFPKSAYVDDAYYGMASAFYRLQEYEQAVKMFLNLVEQRSDSRIQRKAAMLSVQIMDAFLDERELRDLLDKVPSERSRAAVTLRLAQREMDRQHFQAVKEILSTFIDQYPKSAYLSQIRQLYQEADEAGKNAMRVGILLPLSGPYAVQGQGVLDGIQYAFDIHNEGGGVRIEPVIRDTQGEMIRAIKAAQELCRDPEIKVVIGELESNITAAVAAIAQEHHVVFLAPTAAADGLTSIGPYVFQINGNLRTQAEAAADYAVNGLGLKTFAVLYPSDQYGESLRNAFVEIVDALEGEIITEKWYFEGDVDFGPQFRAMREDGIKRMVQDSLLVIVSDGEYEEFYEEQPYQDGVLHVKENIPTLVDSTEFSVTSIEGIFIPAYAEDIQYILPSFTRSNIQARVFGGSQWSNTELLDEQQKSIDDALLYQIFFLSDFYVDPSNFKYFRMRDAFRQAVGKTPERLEVIGFDTASFLLEVIDNQSLLRDVLRDRLARIRHYSGVRGPMSFDDNRVNTSMRLLQYRAGNIVQIK